METMARRSYAEFADQMPIGGVTRKGIFGWIVGQNLQRGRFG
jgi:hypothetical protein